MEMKIRKIVLLLVIICFGFTALKVNVYAEDDEMKLESQEITIEDDENFLLLQMIDADSVSWKIANNKEKRSKKFHLKKIKK